jgi:hypothetical protein
MVKEVAAVIGSKTLKGLSQNVREIDQGSSRGLTQVGLEFGKGHFDGVEIRTVGWQVTDGRALSLNQPFDRCHLVRREVVEDDDVTWLEFRTEHLSQINGEDIAIDGPLNKKRSGDPVMTQCGQKRRALPVAVGLGAVAALSSGSAPVAAGHLGVDARFINENELGRIPSGLVRPPLPTLDHQVRPVLLGGARRFF